jgi:hypothetical protein
MERLDDFAVTSILLPPEGGSPLEAISVVSVKHETPPRALAWMESFIVGAPSARSRHSAG